MKKKKKKSLVPMVGEWVGWCRRLSGAVNLILTSYFILGIDFNTLLSFLFF